MAREIPVGPIVEQLKRHEGLRLTIYIDTEGVPTIGYGRNLESGITEGEAEALLRRDVLVAIADATEVIPRFRALDRVRQQALVNMLFNLGRSRFKTFVKMLAAISYGDWSVASVEALDSRWATQVGDRAREIAHALKYGEWP